MKEMKYSKERKIEILATGFDLATDEINQKGLDVLDKTKYEILKMRFREELKIK